MLMPAELAGRFFCKMGTTKPSRKIQPVCSVIRLLNSLGMKTDAITVVVFSRIQREQQLDSRKYGYFSRMPGWRDIAQISRPQGVPAAVVGQDRMMKNWRTSRAITAFL